MKRIEESGEVSFKQAFVDFWRGLFSFGGRSTRAGFWYGILTMKLMVPLVSLGLLTILNMLIYFLVGTSGLFITILIISILVYIVLSILIEIGTWALFFRRSRDVGFKTTPLVIWVIISLAKEAVPFLPILVQIVNLGLIYVLSVPSGHFVKEYQNGFMKFLFEKPESFEFHDNLRVIKFSPDGTEELVVKGRIMERGKVSFKQAFHDFFNGILSYGGRTTRAGFWKVIPIIRVACIALVTVFLVCLFGLVALYPAEKTAILIFMISVGVGLIIIGALVPLGFANWAVIIRRLRDVGLKLKTIVIGYVSMLIINIIILAIFIISYGYVHGMGWGVLWCVVINLIIQLIFLCLPSGAMATQKEDSKFFEKKTTF